MDEENDYSGCGMSVSMLLMAGGLLLIAIVVLMGGPL